MAAYDADGICQCGRELEMGSLGQPLVHSCCHCGDAKRVTLTRDVTDRRFGESVPCPACTGAKPWADEPREQVRGLASGMGIPLILQGESLETWRAETKRDREIAVMVRGWVDGYPTPVPPLLTFASPTKGCGKSHMAVALMRSAYERCGARGQFMPWVELVGRFRAASNPERATETVEEIHESLSRVDVLVLDDLAAEKSTEFVTEQLYRLVDRRYRDMRPLVVTTNEFERLDERVRSRLGAHRVAAVVQFDGRDRRPRGATA